MVGIGLGTVGTVILHSTGIPITNQFLASLFGGTTVYPEFAWSEVLNHLGLCVLIGLGATMWPLRAAMSISPVRAMATEA
jgi:ABC-type lipoprotein release transport system permease subunit